MTDTAPQAQTQYDGQRWHVEIRMHIDVEEPEACYVTAELSKKVGLGSYHTWLTQERYDWLQGQRELPEAGQSFHTFMIRRIDELRAWLLDDLRAQVQAGKRDNIRPEMGVSLPKVPHQAG